MKRFVVTLALTAVLAGIASTVQAQMPALKPVPEVKKLDYLAAPGRWTARQSRAQWDPGAK